MWKCINKKIQKIQKIPILVLVQPNQIYVFTEMYIIKNRHPGFFENYFPNIFGLAILDVLHFAFLNFSPSQLPSLYIWVEGTVLKVFIINWFLLWIQTSTLFPNIIKHGKTHGKQNLHFHPFFWTAVWLFFLNEDKRNNQ